MSRSRHSKPKPSYLHGCWHCESPGCHHKSHREQRQTPLAEATPAEEVVAERPWLHGFASGADLEDCSPMSLVATHEVAS